MLKGARFCAIERYSMVLALSKFGQFSPLPLTVTSTLDSLPGTHTLSFYGSYYSSPYLTFVPVEGFTNQPPSPTDTGPRGVCSGTAGSGPWSTLQDLSADQQALMAREDPNCGFPFVDVANIWNNLGAFANPGALANLPPGASWQQITELLNNPASTATQALEGGAAQLIAEICEATGGKPAAVCSSSSVQQWQSEVSLQSSEGD